jgi:hypothetical protein
MLSYSLFGLIAFGFIPLSCIAVDKNAIAWWREYPRRCASQMIRAATSRGVERRVSSGAASVGAAV